MRKKGEEYSWIKYIKQRTLQKNKNFICSITGQTGSGKSWSALSIGELIDPNFSVDNIIFKAKDIMKLINSGSLKKGSVIIWDEAGVELSSRNWQSMLNKVINYLLQTFRHKNFVLIFTVPYADFMDVASRKLFHADFETVSVNKNRGTCTIKPKLLQYNAGMKKWYRKYLKVIKRGEGSVKINRWSIPKPSDELVKQYEAKKTAYTNYLNKEIENQLRVVELKGKKPLTKRQEQIKECWEKGITNQTKIGEIIKMCNGQVSENEKFMRRKGYFKDDYLKK